MVNAETLRAVLTADQNVSVSMEAIRSSVKRAAEGMGDASRSSQALSQTLDNMGGEALSTALALSVLENRIDEVGDESTQATAQVHGLSSAFAGVEAGATFAGLRLSITSLITLVVAATAVVGALGAALSGLAIVALGAGGALAAIFGGGLLLAAEQMAARSSEIEGTMEGLEEIASRLKDALSQAIEPLKQPEFANAAISALESLVELVGAVAESIAAISDPLLRAAGAIADAFRAQSTRILAELEQTIVALLPIIEDLASWLARSLPGALAFFREQAQLLLPILGNFGSSLLGLIAQLSELASVVLSVVLPVLTPVIDTLSFVLSLFNRLPRPLKQFVTALTGMFILSQLISLVQVFNALYAVHAAAMSYAAFVHGLYTAAVSAATVAVGALTTALAILTSPITLTIAAIGAVVGALLALADYLGIIPDLGSMMGDFFDWLYDKISVLPGVDGGGGSGDGSSGAGAPPSAPVRERMQRKESKTENNYNIRVDARNSGMSESEISDVVQDAVEETRKEERQRSSGHGG